MPFFLNINISKEKVKKQKKKKESVTGWRGVGVATLLYTDEQEGLWREGIGKALE